MHTPFLDSENVWMVEQQHWNELQREANNWSLANELIGESIGRSDLARRWQHMGRELLKALQGGFVALLQRARGVRRPPLKRSTGVRVT